jgi:hypothetical protein
VLNWAVRYYPIVRILECEGLLRKGTLLEIGSGPIGIGLFRKVPFIGCDLSFAFEPKPPMFPIKASAAELPFGNHIFDTVLSSDVLEHVPPELRTKVVTEALRVCKRLAIFAFPCGEAAWKSDRELREAYRKSNLSVPEWLEEHMLAPFPGPEIFADIPGWSVEQIGNDNLQFHAWLMRKEMSRLFCLAGLASIRLVPWFVESTLKKTDLAPYYRQIFVLRKQNIVDSSASLNENHRAQ